MTNTKDSIKCYENNFGDLVPFIVSSQLTDNLVIQMGIFWLAYAAIARTIIKPEKYYRKEAVENFQKKSQKILSKNEKTTSEKEVLENIVDSCISYIQKGEVIDLNKAQEIKEKHILT